MGIPALIWASLLLLASAPGAQELEELVNAARHPIVVSSDEWSGPGAELLVSAAAEASFFLIGEQHGNRETPEITRILLRKLQHVGYRALAIEVGPLTAPLLVELVDSGEGIEPIRTFLTDYPFAVPFFWWKGEAELLVAAAEAGYALWGLDQEFVGSARHHLSRLSTLASNARATELVAWHEESAWKAFDNFHETGSTEASFLNVATAEDFDALDDAFAGDTEALRILVELRESAAVYQLFGAGRNYESNLRRIELMKRHTADYLRDFDAKGKVILKFGNMHMGRGYSELNQLDLGNLAAELGVLRGGGSFHLSVAGLSRKETDGSVQDYRNLAPYLVRFEPRTKNEWNVFDLQTLRPYFHDDGNRAEEPELAMLAWRFDALLVVPELQAAERIDE